MERITVFFFRNILQIQCISILLVDHGALLFSKCKHATTFNIFTGLGLKVFFTLKAGWCDVVYWPRVNLQWSKLTPGHNTTAAMKLESDSPYCKLIPPPPPTKCKSTSYTWSFRIKMSYHFCLNLYLHMNFIHNWTRLGANPRPLTHQSVTLSTYPHTHIT